MYERQQAPSRYSLPEPYPEVRVTAKNRFYAQLLLEDYASETSELDAINQYLYHSFRFKQWNLGDLAELEEGISIIEMRHMEMLAELILKLGGDPRYWVIRDNDQRYYSTSSVYYGHSVLDMLSADIEAERIAIVNYRRHAGMINDPYVRAVINRIVRDEEYHLQLFSEAYQRYRSTAPDKAQR
ncbi:MAG: bacterioferritin [Firmicutes bacterium]|nr:bacterioferritin [Bacillota bacterium]